MDVNLHLGAHRCGTTTFQHFLRNNRVALADAGLDVWDPRRTRAGLFAGLVRRPDTVTPEIARRGQRSCGVIRTAIVRLEREGYRDLIISDENMIGSIHSNLSHAALYPEAKDRLHRFVAGIGANPRRIGLSIRSYDRLWSSKLSYHIARGYGLPGERKIETLVLQPRRWKTVIEDIAEVFPRSDIVVWPFERYAGQPEQQLSILTGGLTLRPALAGSRNWKNRSLHRPELRQILHNRGASPSEIAQLDGDGPWLPFSEGDQAILRQDYAEDIAWLRDGADGIARFMETPVQTKPITTRGFAASDRTWVPPEGGHDNGSEEIVV